MQQCISAELWLLSNLHPPFSLVSVSPPFPSPSHAEANKMAAAWPFCFLPAREARTLGLGSFLESAAMFEPNSSASTWHRL